MFKPNMNAAVAKVAQRLQQMPSQQSGRPMPVGGGKGSTPIQQPLPQQYAPQAPAQMPVGAGKSSGRMPPPSGLGTSPAVQSRVNSLVKNIASRR